MFRTAMRDTVYPGARLTIEPFEESSSWFVKVTNAIPGQWGDPDDPECIARENERVGRWRHMFDWFRGHAEPHSPVYIGFEEQDVAVVYPRLFLALTPSGSLVGLATCVVWT